MNKRTEGITIGCHDQSMAPPKFVESQQKIISALAQALKNIGSSLGKLTHRARKDPNAINISP